MLELDGSAGGGQLLRTALSLSALSGTPFRMTDVRGARSTPGLRPQHLAAVRALAAVADADVSAADVGAEELTFRPRTIRGGSYEVDVGTAGSLTLLFDAVLPLAAALEEPLRLRATGGTDVKWSPPLDYLRHVKLVLLRRHGLGAAVEPDRRGFYPRGGGEATLWLAPSSLSSLELSEGRDPTGARVYSVASADLADAEVADRQAAEAARRLDAAGIGVDERAATYAAADSPGSAVVVRLDCGIPAGFDALGERGKPAEEVAADAVEAALSFRDGPGAVDEHMADQLVPFAALAGGEVAVPRITDHLETNAELVGKFGYDARVEPADGGAVLRG